MPAERRRRIALAAVLVVGLALWWTRGEELRVPAPEGFAEVLRDDGPHRSLSPDGVLLRVRTAANEPRADLAFASEAMRRHLLEAGYRLVDEGELAAADGAVGFRLELTAAQGAEDHRYLVGVFVADERLVVVEATGEVARFEARRGAILDALARMEIPS